VAVLWAYHQIFGLAQAWSAHNGHVGAMDWTSETSLHDGQVKYTGTTYLVSHSLLTLTVAVPARDCH